MANESVGTEDVSELLSASYVSSMTENLNAALRDDYDNCINSEVLEDPNGWATSFVAVSSLFQVWSDD